MTNNLPNPDYLDKQAQDYIAIFESFKEWLFTDPIHAISTLTIFFLVAIFYSIRKRLGNSVVDLVDKAIGLLTLFAVNYFSGISFSLRYKQHLTFDHRFFNACGLRTRGAFNLEVEKVYVNLKIAPSINSNNKSYHLIDGAQEQALTGDRPIWDFLKQNLKVLVVIGPPGCGKSTLLQHISLAFASGKHCLYGLPAYTPIFLFLREHIEKIVNGEINLAELAQMHFENKKRYPHLNPPKDWFANQLENGKAIVLLDGLDEVANAEKRKKVSIWVDQQIVAYRDCPFIITSRPKGYDNAPLQQVHRLEIQAFSWQQVKEFAASWYLQNEILSSGKNDEGIINKARLGAEDLLKRLQYTSSLKDLTVNPLLLTMIAMVHRYRGQLPGRRVELYSEICDVLLAHWEAAKGLESNLTAIQKRVALQPLAAAMMYSETREIDTQEALKIMEKPLAQINVTDKESGLQFLKDIEVGSGLLGEKENSILSFAHLSFQEYLAACNWLEETPKLNWQSLINKSWWHETIRLYAAQSDASDIIRACLEVNNVSTLTLASECLAEVKKLADNSLRNLLQQRLLSNLESENTELRRMAAEVRLNQRLKRLHRVDDDIEIDLDYITCAEYQLFLDEEYQNGNYYQPEHWNLTKFPEGSADKAVTGVRLVDAKAFCEWLTEKYKGSFLYRLPNKNELELSSLNPYDSHQNLEIAAWTIGSSDSEGKLEFNNEITKNNIYDRIRSYGLDINTEINTESFLPLKLMSFNKPVHRKAKVMYLYAIFIILVSLFKGSIYGNLMEFGLYSYNIENKNIGHAKVNNITIATLFEYAGKYNRNNIKLAWYTLPPPGPSGFFTDPHIKKADFKIITFGVIVFFWGILFFSHSPRNIKDIFSKIGSVILITIINEVAIFVLLSTPDYENMRVICFSVYIQIIAMTIIISKSVFLNLLDTVYFKFNITSHILNITMYYSRLRKIDSDFDEYLREISNFVFINKNIGESKALKELINRIQQNDIISIRNNARELAILQIKKSLNLKNTFFKKMSRKFMLCLKNDLEIVDARLKGDLPSWEGIRIVRENRKEYTN